MESVKLALLEKQGHSFASRELFWVAVVVWDFQGFRPQITLDSNQIWGPDLFHGPWKLLAPPVWSVLVQPGGSGGARGIGSGRG